MFSYIGQAFLNDPKQRDRSALAVRSNRRYTQLIMILPPLRAFQPDTRLFKPAASPSSSSPAGRKRLNRSRKLIHHMLNNPADMICFTHQHRHCCSAVCAMDAATALMAARH